MAINLDVAIRNGDKKSNQCVCCTLITKNIKELLKKEFLKNKDTCVLNTKEIHNALIKHYEKDVLEMFASQDKSFFNKKGELNSLKLLKTRLNDLVFNSKRNAVKNGFSIARTQYENQNYFFYKEEISLNSKKLNPKN